jgi:hypothetical protein
VRVADHLEDKRRQRLIVAGLALACRAVGQLALDRVDIQRRGQVVDDGVQKRLHALLLERRAAEHGRCPQADDRLAQSRLELVDGDLLVAEVPLQEGVVGLGDRLHQVLAVLLDLVGVLRRHRASLELRAGGVRLVPDERLARKQVDDAVEVLALTDGDLHHHRLHLDLGRQLRVDGCHHAEEIRTHRVHLVDEDDAGYAVAVGLLPDRAGLGLDAALGADHENATVEDAHGPLHFHGEVHVPRGVDQVDRAVLPVAGDGGGTDGDAALLLLRHVVGDRVAGIDIADLVDLAGVVENPLRRCGLARIDMSEHAYVACVLKLLDTRHGISLLAKNFRATGARRDVRGRGGWKAARSPDGLVRSNVRLCTTQMAGLEVRARAKAVR